MRELIRVSKPGVNRPRRLRTNAALRDLVRETRLDPSRFVAPLFVVSGRNRKHEIPSLKGHSRISPDLAVAEAHRLAQLGVGGVLLFGIPDDKDPEGRAASDERGPVAETLRMLKAEKLPLVLAADVCLCEYTTHGHCGVLNGDQIDNDATLPLLGEAAVTYAEAGADLVAPSAMMDGQVGALRDALDERGLTNNAIMAYASKQASVFYGPFREAAGPTPSFGDRKSYQMDSANAREAMREMQLDAAEGADILMVKPAMTSLALRARAPVRSHLTPATRPCTREAAMIEAAAERGWVDRRGAILESPPAIARPGPDNVNTYFAADAAS